MGGGTHFIHNRHLMINHINQTTSDIRSAIKINKESKRDWWRVLWRRDQNSLTEEVTSEQG